MTTASMVALLQSLILTGKVFAAASVLGATLDPFTVVPPQNMVRPLSFLRREVVLGGFRGAIKLVRFLRHFQLEPIYQHQNKQRNMYFSVNWRPRAETRLNAIRIMEPPRGHGKTP